MHCSAFATARTSCDQAIPLDSSESFVPEKRSDSIHDEPQRDWTIVSLAHAVGTSRSNLARRFTELVGEPVMTYLTRWRMTLAVDLLADADNTIAVVAEQVGYASPFGFSTAFKRRYGLSPTAHRRPPVVVANDC